MNIASSSKKTMDKHCADNGYCFLMFDVLLMDGNEKIVLFSSQICDTFRLVICSSQL